MKRFFEKLFKKRDPKGQTEAFMARSIKDQMADMYAQSSDFSLTMHVPEGGGPPILSVVAVGEAADKLFRIAKVVLVDDTP